MLIEIILCRYDEIELQINIDQLQLIKERESDKTLHLDHIYFWTKIRLELLSESMLTYVSINTYIKF